MKKIIAPLLFFVMLVCAVSCKKEETPAPAPAPVSTALGSSTDKYIKFKLGGVDYSLTAPQNGAWAAGSHNVESNAGVNYYKTWDTYQPQPGFNLCFSDTTSSTTTTVSDAWFSQLFTTKNYAYAPLNLMQNYTYATGVYLSTKDNSNVFWYSVNPMGSSNQSGAAFTIVEKAEFVQGGDLNIVFKATFNCKMYNSTGDSLMLTNGEMIVSFYNW